MYLVTIEEILKEQAGMLLAIRNVLGDLNVRIHDNVCRLACVYLKGIYPDIEDDDWRKNHRVEEDQIDLVGLGEDKPEVIAEIKTTTVKTLPEQKKPIMKDIDRLNSKNVPSKYFFCIFDEAEEFAKDYIDRKGYNDIKVIRLSL